MKEQQTIRQVIEKFLYEALIEKSAAPVGHSFSDDLVLLQSGLDSLGFARLVTRLEMELGYDPFILSEEPIYPKTFGDFVNAYEKFSSHRV